MSTMLPQDNVTIDITVEDFVTADSVKIQLTAVVGVRDETTDVKTVVVDTFKKIADADWYITNISRGRTGDGYEQATVTGTARIKDNQLNGLGTKIADVNSKPGVQVRLDNTDYTPRQAQMQDAYKALRRKAYEAANQELELINSVITQGGSWRLGQVDFTQRANYNNANSKAFRATATASLETVYASADSMGDDDGFNLTRKVGMSAQITLTRNPGITH